MLSIDHATPADVAGIAALLEELDVHYGAPEVQPRAPRESLIREALFGAAPAGHALLARDPDEQAVGLATYAYHWPAAGVTRSLFLKELYVRRDRRRDGIGRALMTSIREIALARSCSRIEWTTERNNQDAVGFYASLGAEPAAAMLFYRVNLPG